MEVNLENEQIKQENEDLNKIIEGLEKIVIQTKDEFLLDKIDNKRNQLDQLKTNLRSELDEEWHNTLEDLLEIQVSFTQSNKQFDTKPVSKN